jgi:hypothetical protein
MAVLVAVTTVLHDASAQVVRGVVIERVSGLPLRGVLVSVASIPDSLRPGGIRHTLTNVRGEYAMTLARPGRYVVSAKRIGAVRYTAAPVSVASGETRRLDITLAPLESRLPVVKVSATTLCIPRQDQLGVFTRRGFLGIAFRPRTNRITGGINGTIWLDAGTFELRFVEFRYTNLITVPSNPHLGGEVHFLRLESGAWLVRRWLVRMPQFPEIRPVSVTRGGVSPASAGLCLSNHRGGGGCSPPGFAWETL